MHGVDGGIRSVSLCLGSEPEHQHPGHQAAGRDDQGDRPRTGEVDAIPQPAALARWPGRVIAAERAEQ